MKSILNYTKAILFLTIILSSCVKSKEGPAGKDGNANVTGSKEFTAFSNNWTAYQGGSKGTFYSVPVTASQITSAISGKGVVLCYYKLTNDTWAPLPYDAYSFLFGTGNMAIIYDYNVNPGTQTFRIVTIPSTELKKNVNIDYNDYNSVCEIYNLN